LKEFLNSSGCKAVRKGIYAYFTYIFNGKIRERAKENKRSSYTDKVFEQF
jgi:hypothetical protein